jgi:hypothetical protein
MLDLEPKPECNTVSVPLRPKFAVPVPVPAPVPQHCNIMHKHNTYMERPMPMLSAHELHVFNTLVLMCFH